MAKTTTQIELILQDGQVIGATSRVNASLQSIENQAKRIGDSTAFLSMAGQVAALSVALKAGVVDVATYAARTGTLVVVTDQLAKANTLNRSAVMAQVQAVKSLGISTQEAHSTVQKMIFAQLDVAKASQLARLAQDAAVISGVNSSEALENIITGITTGQTRLLHTMGLQVSLDQVVTEGNRKLGREMSEVEKRTAMLNKVLSEGQKITGTYEAAMGTTGKQLTSLKRYIDEAKNAIGEGFSPALSQSINLLRQMAQWSSNNAEASQKMAAGITAAALAMTAAKFTPGGPIPKAVVGGAVGIGAYLFGNQDLPTFYRDTASDMLAENRRKLDELNQRAGTMKAEDYKTQFEFLSEQQREIRRQFVENVSKIYEQRGQGQKLRYGAVPDSTDLGYGVTVGRGDIIRSIVEREQRKASPEPLFNVSLAQQQAQEQARAEFEKRVKDAREKVKDLALSLLEEGLDPIAKLEAKRVRELAEVGLTPDLREKIDAMYAQRRRQMMEDALSGVGRPAKYYDSLAQMNAGAYSAQNATFVQALSATGGLGRGAQGYGANVESFASWAESFTATRAQADEHRLAASRAALQHQERMMQLLAGPGGEVAVINQSYALRMKMARDEFDVRRDLAAFEQAQDEAKWEREERLAELRKKSLEEYKSSVMSAFDALVSGGRGAITSFLKSQGMGVARQVVGNIAGMTYSSGRLSLTDNQNSLIGKLLQGTPFGADPLKTAGVTLDMAGVKLNLAADKMLAMSATGGGGGLVRSATSLLGSLPGVNTGTSLIGSIPGQQPISTAITDSLAKIGVTVPGSAATPKLTLARGIGIGGAVAGGALGVYSGIQTGGAKGALTAGGSLSGAAGSIIGLSGVSGPAAPILAGVGLALGLATMLFGDPKKKRADYLSSQAESRRFTEPTGAEYSTDIYGRSLDYDYRGRVRPVVVNNYNISAMDAKSFVDWGKANPGAISEVTTSAIISGNAEDLLGTVRQYL